MERKLATIRRIKEIKPIVDADNIELAIIDGWQCVVKKNEFKVNELGIYFEIDSFLPCIEPYLFLENKGRKTLADGSEGYRLKTMKLRGVISQGLLLPLHLWKWLPASEVTVGEDLTNLLGIKKYEVPIPAQLAGQVKGSFPGFIQKTDEERIQNLPEYFKKYKDETFEATEKLDGTSCTYYFKDNEFGVCSRNLNLKETEGNVYWKIARLLNIEETFKALGRNFAIQGEIIGEGIQKNKYKLKGQEFYLFNIWLIEEQRYCLPEERKIIFNILQKLSPSLKHVPIIEKEFKPFSMNIEFLIKYSDGKSILNPLVDREGVVYKLNNEQISFKVISNKYLLKNEE